MYHLEQVFLGVSDHLKVIHLGKGLKGLQVFVKQERKLSIIKTISKTRGIHMVQLDLRARDRRNNHYD